MSKRIILSLSVLSLSLLQACGGGGEGGSVGNAAPVALISETTADIGTVSARFVPNENMRSMQLSSSNKTIGPGGAIEQTESGAIVRIGSRTLSGASQTVDIAGDEHFALGRWVKGAVTEPWKNYTPDGTVTDTTKTLTLNGKDGDAHHYIVYNSPTEMPNSGEFQCNIVAATTPTRLYGLYTTVSSASGSARVSFDASGAAIQGAMQVHVGEESGSTDLGTHLKHVSRLESIGHLLSNGGSGAGVALADQGNGVPALVVGYKVQLPSGASYSGVARLACTGA